MPQDEKYAQGASACVRGRPPSTGGRGAVQRCGPGSAASCQGPCPSFPARDSQVQALLHTWLGVRVNRRPHSSCSLEPAAPLPFRPRAVCPAWGRALLQLTPLCRSRASPWASPWLPRSTDPWALSRSVPSAGTRVSHCARLAADLRSRPCVVLPGHPTGRYRQLCPHHQGGSSACLLPPFLQRFSSSLPSPFPPQT